MNAQRRSELGLPLWPDRATYTRRRLFVAGAIAAIPATLFTLRGTSAAELASPPATDPNLSPTTLPNETTGPSPTTPPSSLPTVQHDLALGMVDDDVAVLQQRLIDLAYDPGPVDGYFGHATRRAVWAFEKLTMSTPREEASGVVTGAVWDAMLASVATAPRRTGQGDRHTEIYLPEQVIAVFHAGRPVLVSHISSGSGDEWCEIVTIDVDERGRKLDEVTERDVCGISTTPGGVFEYFRRIAGIRNGALGSMWNPVYFNYGIAVHGAIDVPLHLASHGCIRIPMHISDYFQTLVANGDRVVVWNGEREPEQLSEREMLPVFDYPNPNSTATTTTTTTTTTTPTTTTTTTTATSTPTTTTVPEAVVTQTTGTEA